MEESIGTDVETLDAILAEIVETVNVEIHVLHQSDKQTHLFLNIYQVLTFLQSKYLEITHFTDSWE